MPTSWLSRRTSKERSWNWAERHDPTSGKEGRSVKIEYDPESDALYIQIREAHADDNIDIEEGVTVDVDENKHIVGVEILDASKRLSASDLSSIIIQKLPLETTIP